MSTPENLPTTGRGAAFHARQLGYVGVAEFAASLPPAATVADVGAGLSPFGATVAKLRPDVVWFNIDPCYASPKLAKKMRTAPDNLRFLTDNIVEDSEGLSQLRHSVDLVYSYWLVPHLSLRSDEPARQALGNMHQLLSSNGRLVVGPRRRGTPWALPPYARQPLITHGRRQHRADVAAAVLEETRLRWPLRTLLRYTNDHEIHLAKFLLGGRPGI